MSTTTDQATLLTYVLRQADDNLVLAQRLGELIAGMPDLEEDIAVANVALDHLGHARNFYNYASDLDPDSRTEDQFAMLRSEREFLNSVMVEQPNGDFAHTMVRQLFVDAYQVPLYEGLAESSDEMLAAIGAKSAKEALYHLDRSSTWVITLGNGTAESKARSQQAVDDLWRFTADLFTADEVEQSLAAAGVVPAEADLASGFQQTVNTVLAEANLVIPEDPYQRLGGRTGFHTSELGHLLPELQWQYRAHPGVSW